MWWVAAAPDVGGEGRGDSESSWPMLRKDTECFSPLPVSLETAREPEETETLKALRLLGRDVLFRG